MLKSDTFWDMIIVGLINCGVGLGIGYTIGRTPPNYTEIRETAFKNSVKWIQDRAAEDKAGQYVADPLTGKVRFQWKMMLKCIKEK